MRAGTVIREPVLTTLAIAGDAYQRMTGPVFGLLFATVLVGGLTFPWLIGQIADMTDVRAGMVVRLLGVVGIYGMAWKIKKGRKT